jgi:hypothetical protein
MWTGKTVKRRTNLKYFTLRFVCINKECLMKHRNFRFWWPFAGLGFAALFSCVVMLLWNWLLPNIAGLPEITFLQAVGLLVLARILFGGIGGPGKMAMGGAMRGGDRGQFREKWGKMSDEERQEFLRKHHPLHAHIFGDLCGDSPRDPGTPAEPVDRDVPPYKE